MKTERIIAIKKDNLDRIIEFKTDSNKIYNYEMAKEAITNGLIENARLIKGNDTLWHIKEKNNGISFEKMEEFQ